MKKFNLILRLCILSVCLMIGGCVVCAANTERPGIPDLKYVQKSPDGISLSWEKVSGADGYSIYKKSDTEVAFTYMCLVSADSDTYIDTSVLENHVYTYKVCAYRYKEDWTRVFGKFSNSLSAGYIRACNLVQVAKSYPCGIECSWEEKVGVDGYSIYRKEESEGAFSYLQMVSAQQTSYIDETAIDGKVYFYKVCAFKQIGSVRYFGYFGNTLGATHIESPSILSVICEDSGTRVYWSDQVNVDGYSIYRKARGGTWKYICMVPSSNTMYFDENVDYNGAYSYKVCGFRSLWGKRYFGWFSQPKAQNYIESPTISSIELTDNGVALEWGSIPGSQGYSVYRKKHGDTDFTYQKMVTEPTYVDITTLSNNMYQYKVCAYYYNGGNRCFGGFSAVREINTFISGYHVLTLIDDDGYNSFYEKLLPLIKEYGISISTAIETDNVGIRDFMSWEVIEECHKSGAEVLNHTKEHYTTIEEVAELTDEEIKESFLIAKNMLEAHGYSTGNILVYSGATVSRTWSIAKDVFRCGINSSGNVVNTLPFNLFNLRRYRVGSTHTPDFSELKSYIDEVAKADGWEIWMMHSHNGYMDDEYIDALKQAIEYCDTVNVKIMSVEEALDLFNIG